jgi:hypothetical protein
MINPEILRKLRGLDVGTKTILLVVLAVVLSSGFWLSYWISIQELNRKAKIRKCIEDQVFSF